MIPKNQDLNFNIRVAPGLDFAHPGFKNGEHENNVSYSEENIPTLGAHLGENTSIELCPSKIRHGNNQLYSQWEIEADDYEERLILENLKSTRNKNKIGMMNQENLINVAEHRGQNAETKQIRDIDTLTIPTTATPTKSSHICNIENEECKLGGCPDPKKVKRIKSAVSEGETLVSEFIQDHIELDDGSFFKSVKTESKYAGSELHIPEENTPILNRSLESPPPTPQSENNLETAPKQSLKSSEIAALIKKRQLEVQKAMRFNIMVVGQSGLGKSTFIDAFLDKKYINKNNPIRSSTVDIIEYEGTRCENGINLKMNFIDTPGYSADKNFKDWYKTIKDYIIKQFEKYKLEKKEAHNEKKQYHVKKFEDTRVHALLYFIAGPRISKNDIIAMQKLKKYANIIPILARGDSLTLSEIKELKNQLGKEAYDNKIEWFDFKEALKDSPEKLKEVLNGRFGISPPFLIISSATKIQVSKNNYIYGREYSWGLCNIENPNHSDFVLLKSLLGGHICLEAIQYTHFFYKEYFNKKKENQRIEASQEKQKVGVVSLVALGAVGIFFAIKKKFEF